jgi:hypothetical protein
MYISSWVDWIIEESNDPRRGSSHEIDDPWLGPWDH